MPRQGYPGSGKPPESAPAAPGDIDHAVIAQARFKRERELIVEAEIREAEAASEVSNPAARTLKLTEANNLRLQAIGIRLHLESPAE